VIHPWDAIWIFLILSSLQPLVQKHPLALSRRRMPGQVAARCDATVITLIQPRMGRFCSGSSPPG